MRRAHILEFGIQIGRLVPRVEPRLLGTQTKRLIRYASAVSKWTGRAMAATDVAERTLALEKAEKKKAAAKRMERTFNAAISFAPNGDTMIAFGGIGLAVPKR